MGTPLHLIDFALYFEHLHTRKYFLISHLYAFLLKNPNDISTFSIDSVVPGEISEISSNLHPQRPQVQFGHGQNKPSHLFVCMLEHHKSSFRSLSRYTSLFHNGNNDH